MSQFFADFEDTSESKRRTYVKDDSSDDDQNVTKRDQRLNSLKLEVMKSEESMNNRGVQKVLKIVSKNPKQYVGQRFLSNYFDRVLLEKKIGQSIKDKIIEIKRGMESGTSPEDDTLLAESEYSDVPNKLNIQDMVEEAVNLKDYDARIERLNHLLKLSKSNQEKFCVLTARLFTTLFKCEPSLLKDVYSGIGEVISVLEVDTEDKFRKQVRTILNSLISFVRKEDSETFKKIIEVLSKWDGDCARKIELEFEYYIEGNYVKNDDPVYGLLYLVKNDIASAISMYMKNKEMYLNLDETPVFDSLLEMGDFLFDSKEYKESYEMLSKCYFSGYKSAESRLSVLCCVLNEEVEGTKFYDKFVDELISLEDNVLMLKSGVPKFEVYRSFFLLRNSDYESCENILRMIEPGLECTERLKRYALKCV